MDLIRTMGTHFQGVADGAFCLSSDEINPLTDHNTCTDALVLDDFLSATEDNPSQVGPFDNTLLGSNIMPDPNAENIGIECWEDGPTEDGSVWFTFHRKWKCIHDFSSLTVEMMFCLLLGI